MKLFITLIVSLAVYTSNCQSIYVGLYGSSFIQQSSRDPSKMERIKKEIYIVYSKNHCSFYVEGRGTINFPVRNYSVQLVGESIQTSFLSQETNTSPDGRYTIIINESKDKIYFQVALPNFTYLVDRIDKYSENGQVTQRVFVKNYLEIERQQKVKDSLSSVNEKGRVEAEKKRNSEDSIFFEQKRKDDQELIEKSLLSGNNFNESNIKWISDTLRSRINLEEKETFYNNFRVDINSDGEIVNIEPSDKQGFVLPKYLPVIKKIIVGRKVQPYFSGTKTYPSYSYIYISLYHNPDKVKKEKGKNLLNILKSGLN